MLIRLIVAPEAAVRALRSTGDNAGAHLGDGDVQEMIAAHHGAAILGRVRPDLLAVDMDGTAAHLEDVEDAAAVVGAVRVYLALSGSADSLHVVYAPPTVAARQALVAALRRLSAMVGGGVNPRTPEEWLRLPGSPSLKDGCGPVEPVEREGDIFMPLEPTKALKDAQAALEARKHDRAALGVPFNTKEFTSALANTASCTPSTRETAGPLSTRTSCELDQEARRALALSCPQGGDATLHALRAAWHLWRCGYRVWDDVADIVMRSPALSRWRRGGPREAARRWQMEAGKWAAWRPELEETAAGRLTDAQASAALLPPDLEAVLLAVLDWMGKTGRAHAVPVAVRDLVVWGVCGSVGSAQRALEALEIGGVLLRARRWEDGPAEEATLWTLQPPPLWQVPGVQDSAGIWNIHTHPPLGALRLHPVWLEVGHTSRRLLELLLASPHSSAPSLAPLLGLGASTVRGYLAHLEELGLASRERKGRSTLWTASVDGWSSLPAVRAAEEAHDLRVQQMGAERAAWRAGLEQARVRRSTPQEEILPGLLSEVELMGRTPIRIGEFSSWGAVVGPGERWTWPPTGAPPLVRASTG